MPEWKLLTTFDADQWRRHLPARRSVFGSVEYAQLCEKFAGICGRLVVMSSDAASISYPMLLRPLSELPFAGDMRDKWDATTPEYTGPHFEGIDPALASGFSANYSAFARDNGIVAGFAHLHPWSAQRELLSDGCVYNRDIVWADVTVPPEVMFPNHLEHSCRKNVHKAQREGVTIKIESSDEAIAKFFRIYVGTMRRREAYDRYYFSLDFFKTIRNTMPDNSRFVFAEHKGRMIAATLYLHDDKSVYSFLGGADAEFNELRPTNLVIWNTILWAHETGKERLILGGGYKPNDGIFRFKATFSPLRQPFYVFKSIHMDEEYALLEQRCREYYGHAETDDGYFPGYRRHVAR
jgi:serine/alanine adding enzyme